MRATSPGTPPRTFDTPPEAGPRVTVDVVGDLVRAHGRPRVARGAPALRAVASLGGWAVIFRLLAQLGVRPRMVPLPLLVVFTLGFLVVVERYCWLLFGRQVIESDGRAVRARRVLFGLGFGRWQPIDPAARWVVENVRSPESSLIVIDSPGERARRLAIDLPPHQTRALVDVLARRGLAHTFD